MASIIELAPLHGSCSCGRNQYMIALPSDPVRASSLATVVFDDSSESRLTHSTPLPTFLRILLTHLQSTTYAYHPDESHATIRRTFTPRHAPHTKRHFCGFCGSQLSYWSEGPTRQGKRQELGEEDEADWIWMNLGSLEDGSVRALEELGVFPDLSLSSPEEDEEEPLPHEPYERAVAPPDTIGAPPDPAASGEDLTASTPHVIGKAVPAVPAGPSHRTRTKLVSRQGNRGIKGQPWFEEVVEGTKLGRIKRRRGGQTSSDGRGRWEWSVVEYEDGVDDEPGEGMEEGRSNGKRKAGEMAGEAGDVGGRVEGDIVMSGGL